MSARVPSGQTQPSREEFVRLAADSRVIPVIRTVLADGLTPLALYRRLSDNAPGTFLMESAAAGGVWSRYSFIGARSAATLSAVGDQAHWQGTVPAGLPLHGDALEVLAETLDLLGTGARDHISQSLPHLVSGLVGFLGWDAVRHWERLEHPPEDVLGLPRLAFNLVTDLAVHDAAEGTITLIANAVNVNGLATGAEQAYDDACARLDSMLARLAAPAADPVSAVPQNWLRASAEEVAAAARDDWGEDGFLEAVALAQEAIRDGEVFQAVVSRRFTVDAPVRGESIYRVLRMLNPSPYMYLFTFETPDGEPYQIVGSSPEALVTVEDRHVITHPIAGSRRRGPSEEDDVLAAKDLEQDEKERAEHIMLVDLSRNDLSRVCEPGSVQVSQFMEIEKFSHIIHLVSHVQGQVRRELSPLDVLRAAFPAGTLSGAPKPRALQLLDEWEPVGRGPYGGVVGYFDLAGTMDMAINIRSVTLHRGQAHVQAGAGIVADSVPAAEAAETVTKASAPLRAVLTALDLESAAAASDTPEN
ncbi:MAG: chorismate-binding protein [Micrococcus sp.]|nr:chorismate-binding protein [Micrococcus sp.]